jgi:hypothetical protein
MSWLIKDDYRASRRVRANQATIRLRGCGIMLAIRSEWHYSQRKQRKKWTKIGKFMY